MRFWIISATVACLIIGSSYAFVVRPMHSSVDTVDVAQYISVSARAPHIVSMKGAAYAIVSGELNGTASVKVIGSGNYGTEEFIVGPGSVTLACGGAEAWIEGYRVEYLPLTANQGSLYISVYCGKLMDHSDRHMYNKIVSAKP